jgi:hypothetical protein
MGLVNVDGTVIRNRCENRGVGQRRERVTFKSLRSKPAIDP